MQIESGKTRIGWIGLGVMGSSMCGHLVDNGFSATVYTRTKSKAQTLLDKGAAWAESPNAVAENSDVIFSIVGFPSDVRQVLLGPDGALNGAATGSVLVDMTTSEPSLAVEVYEAAKAKGIHSVDAPVSGGDVGAKEARLSIMIGGDKEVVESLQPCWQVMGKTIVHQGPAGAGQHTKMVNQTLIATNMIGVCEALLYGCRAGLDLETVMKSVATGAAGSWSLSNLGPRIIANNFDPGFFVEHFIKDMGIALSEANRMGLALPGLALAKQLYEALQAQGHGRDGTHALQLALSALSGIVGLSHVELASSRSTVPDYVGRLDRTDNDYGNVARVGRIGDGLANPQTVDVGKRRSKRMRSGWADFATSTASLPSRAASVLNPSCCNRNSSNNDWSSSSSTIKTDDFVSNSC